jgi:hypothetical protein
MEALAGAPHIDAHRDHPGGCCVHGPTGMESDPESQPPGSPFARSCPGLCP